MLSTPGHTAIHVLLNLYTHQQAVKNKHAVQRNTNHLLSWLKRRHGGYSGCPNCCHVWTARLEQSNGSDKSVYTLSLTSKPTGVHTTRLSPKPHAPGRIHSCSTSRGPIGLRMWKNLGLHFRWNSKESRKASVCPWVQHSWLTHHLPPLRLQGSDPQEGLPFCSAPPTAAGKHSFPSSSSTALTASVPGWWSLRMVRRKTWINTPSRTVTTTHNRPQRFWNTAVVTEEPHF